MNYIDIHGHINFPEYDADREEVIKRAHDAGVGIITVGTDLVSSRACVALAEKHDDMWAIIGMHPTEAAGSRGDGPHIDSSFDIAAFTELARHPKVVAIGECGLDYFHSEPGDMESQKNVFIQHIALANTVRKPLMLHVRNATANTRTRLGGEVPPDSLYGFEGGSYSSQKGAPLTEAGGNAYQEAIQILRTYAKVPANFHFFAGTMEDMNEALSMGCSISFTGVVTFARNYDELIRSAPADKIMTETDCPFVAPIPYRGKRNEPSYVIEVVKKIAEIRGESADKVAERVLANARNFFGLQK
ncbi:MAG: TatD family hydrolase [Candidatus Taylorbacteria bacterium]